MKAMGMILAMALAGGTALAHGGVQNPAVLARMEAMTQIGDAMKLLAGMMKGETAFDAGQAQAALDRIRAAAARTPALFEAPETDPKSEALPAIWQNWADFRSKSDALYEAAGGTIVAPGDLRPMVSRLAGSCKACHRDYRLKR